MGEEPGRIEFLVRRDGVDAAVVLVDRTMRVYRRAVLDKRHFASASEYRRKFIEAYCEFKRWLRRVQESK
jgi:hypothetical protein